MVINMISQHLPGCGDLSNMSTGCYPAAKNPENSTKAFNVHVLRSKGRTSIKGPRPAPPGGDGVPVFVNFEVGDEPADVRKHREEGGKAPKAPQAGIYARGPAGPSATELAAATRAWLQANCPSVLSSAVENKFRALGWKIIWTPPYCPKFQPIELVWGAGKQRTASLYFPGHNFKQTRLDLRKGFYGCYTDSPRSDWQGKKRGHRERGRLLAHGGGENQQVDLQ